MVPVDMCDAAAIITGKFFETAVPNGIVHSAVSRSFHWIFRNPFPDTQSIAFSAFGVASPTTVIVFPIVFYFKFTIRSDIQASAFLTLAQMSIRHLRVTVELREFLARTAFETRLHQNGT